MLEAAREDIEILRRRYVSAIVENEYKHWGRSQCANAFDHPVVTGRTSVHEALSILDYGPKQGSIREDFNLQPNGRSPIWLIVSGRPPDQCRISFDGEVLNTTISDCVVTAAIPQSLLEVPRVVKINLVGNGGQLIADDVGFSIKPDVTATEDQKGW
jgi:hypothetical protein